MSGFKQEGISHSICQQGGREQEVLELIYSLFSGWAGLQLTWRTICPTHQWLVSSPAVKYYVYISLTEVQTTPVIPLRTTVHDHRESQLGCCPTLLLAPFSLYFSLYATLALGSVLVSLPPRAMVQLPEMQPALVSPNQSPGTQQGTVHVRD